MSRAFRIGMITLLSAGGALLLAGTLLFFIGFGLEGWDVDALRSAHFALHNYTAAGNIESVHIHYESASIRIESGENFSLAYPVRTNSRGDVLAEVNITEEDGVLTVTEEKRFPIWGISLGTGNAPELVLTLPEKEYGEITATVSAGSTSAEGIAARSLTLTAGAGNVEVKDVHIFGAAAFTASMGNIDLRRIETGSLTVAADVGNIEGEDVRAENAAAFTASMGNIDLRAVDSAEVRLTNDLGDIGASLTGTKENYTVRVQTELGSCNIVDRDGGSRRLYAETQTGNIRVDFLG